ncbi:MAG: trigger factor [Solirubrobacterales bacterium]|nr:trigger factor [Solirubrobacterales bacterium]
MAVKTTVTELPESRVRVEAEVPPEEVKRRVQEAAGRLGRDLRMPGFRKGKVPAPVVIQRVGREAVLDEAVRGSLGRWYVEAIDASGIKPVGDPDVDLGDLPGEGQPLTFSIEIGVRPTATLGAYEGIEVGRREPAADEEQVQQQVDVMREQHSRLETAERAAASGDVVVMDYIGRLDGEDEPFPGGEGRDQSIELGSGGLIPGFEDQLEGAAAGDEREVKVSFPEEYPQAEHLAGRPATFTVTVKEVKAKLKPSDEELAEANGFDSFDELRQDIADRIMEADERRAEAEYREAVLDAVVDQATIDVPDALVEGQAKQMWDNMLHSLSHRGINKQMYLQIAGKTEQELLDEARPDAERALRREAVLQAVIQAEGIEIGDGDVLDAIQDDALQQGMTPEKLRKRLEKDGRIDELKESLAQRRAVEVLAEKAKPIPAEQAEARDKLWTPEKEGAEGKSELWTPGS